MTFIHFIGIDISKNFFDVAYHAAGARSAKAKESQHQAQKFANTPKGYRDFCATYSDMLPDALVVLESTGGYETALVAALVKDNVAVHRADPLTAKHFIRSLGKRAKTDALDAAALARYGAERHTHMTLCKIEDKSQTLMNALLARRGDLVAMRVAEQARLKHPRYVLLKDSLGAVLATLDNEINQIEKQMHSLIVRSPKLAATVQVLTSVKGVGKQTAYALLGGMPELGTLTRRQAASLAGCAPHPRDSGNTVGYRRTIGGRAIVKRALFMAAMAARNFHPELRPFYEHLIKQGKKPMVALTALMRKLITILNAKLRDEIYAKTW